MSVLLLKVGALDTCDGSLSSVKEIGLRGVLARLVQHETDAAIRMLTNLVSAAAVLTGYYAKGSQCTGGTHK